MKQEERPHYSLIHITGMCGAMIGFQLAYVAVFGLVDPIMTKMQLSDYAKLATWLIGPVVGFFVQPFIGYYSDRLRWKIGRRRPFIIFGSIGTCLCFLALYLLERHYSKFSRGVNTFFIIAIVLVVMTSMNTYQGPSRAIIGDILPIDQQDVGYTIGTVMMGVASILASLLAGIGYFVESKWLSDNMTNILLIFGSGFVFICMLLTVFCAKEEEFTGEVTNENVVKTLWHAFLNIPKPILRVAIALLFSQAAFFPYSTKMTTFFSHEVFPEGESSKGLCFGMFSFAVVYSLVMIYGVFHVKITKLIGLKATYLVTMVIMALSLGGCVFTLNRWVLLGIFAPIGIPFLVFNSVPFTVVGIVASEAEMCTYMSLMNNFIIFGQLVGNIITGTCNAITEAIPNCYDYVKKNQAVIGSGSICAILSAIASIWIIDPTPKYNAIIDSTPLIENEKK
jgi:Na+/melibiose symporter-like transporter